MVKFPRARKTIDHKQERTNRETHLAPCLVFDESPRLSGGEVRVPGGVEQREEYPVSQPPLLVGSATSSLQKKKKA